MRHPFILSLCVTPLLAAAAQPSAPVATYWISTETSSGFSTPANGAAMGVGDIARMMMSGSGVNSEGNRTLFLQLGSQLTASSEPAASHEIPKALRMGTSLPLISPRKTATGKDSDRDETHPEEKPKGRLLLYWGCGEQAGPSQPLIIDFAKMAAGKGMGVLSGRAIAQSSGPTASNSRSYGDWPNEKDASRVPVDASLQGDHLVRGNYTPDVRFALNGEQDFLAPVSLTLKKTGSKAMSASWKSIAHATGYFAAVMGSKEGSEDMVWWTSSNSKEFGETLFHYLSNQEAARLVKEKVILPPSVTECTIPAQVVAATPSAMVRFIAYGQETNLVHPPRPQDPKQRWVPEWAVKVRHKSTTGALLEESSGSHNAAGEGSGAGSVGGTIIRGLFGF